MAFSRDKERELYSQCSQLLNQVLMTHPSLQYTSLQSPIHEGRQLSYLLVRLVHYCHNLTSGVIYLSFYSPRFNHQKWSPRNATCMMAVRTTQPAMVDKERIELIESINSPFHISQFHSNFINLHLPDDTSDFCFSASCGLLPLDSNYHFGQNFKFLPNFDLLSFPLCRNLIRTHSVIPSVPYRSPFPPLCSDVQSNLVCFCGNFLSVNFSHSVVIRTILVFPFYFVSSSWSFLRKML